jgi:flagellar biosynthesis protein FliR
VNLSFQRVSFRKLLHLTVIASQVDNYENISRTRNFSLTITVHIAYCILQTILMLNLLIAMMSRTFNASMDDTHK